MASSISSELVNMQSATAKMEAEKAKIEGPDQELGQDTFLKLMLKQLEYQDPLSPMDNTEFLAQQAQFTQVNELQKLNETMAANNQIMQASTLIGKEVTLMDPDDESKTITGQVTSANFSDSLSSITVNGKPYPLAYVMSVKEATPTTAPTESTTAPAENITEN